MKTFLYFSLIVIFFSLSNCKKNDPLPTLEPLSYYPVYPGSYWKYQVNDTTEEILTADPEYRQHSYATSSSEHSGTVYVPFLNGKPVYGYDNLLYNTLLLGYYREPFLSEKVGDRFDGSFHDPRHDPFTYDDITVIKKNTIGTHSIITTQRQYGSHRPGETSTICYTEYTKNIGITKYCVIDGSTLDTTYKKVLIDCLIKQPLNIHNK